MLSYNTDKYYKLTLKRIKNNLFSKQQLNTASGKACQNLNNNDFNKIRDTLGKRRSESNLATKNFLNRSRISIGQPRIDALGYGAIGATKLNFNQDHTIPLDGNIPAHKKALIAMNNLNARFQEGMDELHEKRLGTVYGGGEIGWAEKQIWLFHSGQINSNFNGVSGVLSTDRPNGSRQVMEEMAIAPHLYHKRSRSVGEHVHEGWGTIIGDGYKGLTSEKWEQLNEILTDESHPYHDVIKLNDLYNDDGTLNLQVPKNVIESLHNLDGASIQTAQNILREAHYDENDDFNIGHIYSDDKEERAIAMEKVKEKISVMGDDNPQLAIFQHMLEARETPRTWNNMMQVVMHGQENMHMYLRNMYGAVAMNQLNMDEHGATLDLNDREKISRAGLINEMAMLQTAYQIGRDVYGREPTTKEVKKIRSQGIQDPATKEHITVGKSPEDTSSIKGVSAEFQALMVEAVDLKSMEITGDRKFENLGTNASENNVRMKVLAQTFGIDKHLNKNGTRSGTEKEIMDDPDVDKKIRDMLITKDPNTNFDDLDIQLEIKSVKKYLHQVAKQHSVRINADGSKKRIVEGKVIQGKPKLSQSEKLVKTTNLNDVLNVLQKPDELVVLDKYARIERAERRKLWSAFNSDGSWNEETELAQGETSAGYFNRSLDLFTSVQVNRLEYGDHASKGGSAWGFEDHHIFGKGDNQANTHFALAFKPLHQSGLHMTNYLIEDYNTVQESLRIQHEILKQYESQILTGDPGFEMSPTMIALIRSFIDPDGNINEVELKKHYYTDAKGKTHLKNGSTMPAMTLFQTEVGYAPSATMTDENGNIINQTGNGREHLKMQEHHGVYLIPPMRKTVVQPGGHYENSTSYSFNEGTDTESLSGWSNASGSILQEARTLTLEQINSDIFSSMSEGDKEKLRSMINEETGTVNIPYHSEFYFIEMNDKRASQMGEPKGN